MENKERVEQVMKGWQRAIEGCAPPKGLERVGGEYSYHYELLLESCVPIEEGYDDGLKEGLKAEKNRLRDEVYEALSADLQDKLLATRYLFRLLALARIQAKEINATRGIFPMPSFFPGFLDDEEKTVSVIVDEEVWKIMEDSSQSNIELDWFVDECGKYRLRLRAARSSVPPKDSMFRLKGYLQALLKAGGDPSD